MYGRTYAVFLDGAKVGFVSAGKYRWLIVRPGKHSVGEGWEPGVEASVELTIDDGKNYFVRITQQGLSTIIETIGEEQGRNLVRESKLAGRYRNLAGKDAGW